MMETQCPVGLLTEKKIASVSSLLDNRLAE